MWHGTTTYCCCITINSTAAIPQGRYVLRVTVAPTRSSMQRAVTVASINCCHTRIQTGHSQWRNGKPTISLPSPPPRYHCSTACSVCTENTFSNFAMYSMYVFATALTLQLGNCRFDLCVDEREIIVAPFTI